MAGCRRHLLARITAQCVVGFLFTVQRSFGGVSAGRTFERGGGGRTAGERVSEPLGVLTVNLTITRAEMAHRVATRPPAPTAPAGSGLIAPNSHSTALCTALLAPCPLWRPPRLLASPGRRRPKAWPKSGLQRRVSATEGGFGPGTTRLGNAKQGTVP